MSRSARVLAGVAVLLLFLVAGVVWRDVFSAQARANKRLVAALESPPGTRVSLPTLVPGRWDTAYVFTPTTEESRVDATLGFTWRSPIKTQIGASASYSFVVFVRGGRVLLATQTPDARAVGCGAGLLRLPAREAVFTVERLADGEHCLRHLAGRP